MAATATGAMRAPAAVGLLGVLLGALALPFAGAALAGLDPAAYWDFPPRTRPPDDVPGFAWPAFAAMAVPVAALVVAFGVGLARAPAGDSAAARRFPWWGWLAVGWLLAWWVVAWTRLDVFSAIQRHTFTPLWLGFVVLVNALAWRRRGWSLLTHRPGLVAALFPVSALMWWGFELYNRFIQNWYYTGVEPMSDLAYFLNSTIPFSTVLPAVAGAWVWLAGWPRLANLAVPAVTVPRKPAAAAGLLTGVGALVWLGAAPSTAYPAVWLGPALIVLGLNAVLGGEPLLPGLERGRAAAVAVPAAAALACGVCWELWNYHSLAKWHYAVPYADVVHVFEMPLLGYAGYLPFGLVCALVVELTARAVSARGLLRASGGV